MRREQQDVVRAVSLAVLMICSMIGGGVTFTGSVAADHPDVDVSDLEGSGTEADPYVITTAPELQAMEDDLNASYVLMNDIDASGTTQWNSGQGFDPIGGVPGRVNNTPNFANSSSDAPYFSGSVNGNNHTITGLTIDRPSENYTAPIRGSEGTVTDITFTDTTVTGKGSVGGLVGLNAGSLTNVTVSGSINGSANVGGVVGVQTGGTITNATASGSVSAYNGAAGLVGTNGGSLTDVKSSMDVTRNDNLSVEGFAVGGLVALHSGGPITNATASGNVTANNTGSVGGLVALHSGGPITNATASGSVTATRGSALIGGLVGFQDNGVTVENSTASGNVTAIESEDIGGLVGSHEGTITNATASGKVTTVRSVLVGGLVGSNYGEITDSTASGDVVGNSSSGVGGFAGKSSENLTNMTTSNNVSVNRSDRSDSISRSIGGFVGINSAALINVTASGTVTGDENVGGLVGETNEVTSVITSVIIDSRASGDVTGEGDVGGLIGLYDDGTVTDVTASGNITGDNNVGGLIGRQSGVTVTNATASGNITGEKDVGGLVGQNTGGTITTATATGSVTGDNSMGGLVGRNVGAIQNATAEGSVTGDRRLGGLVGLNRKGAITDAIATGSVNGTDEVGGLVGQLGISFLDSGEEAVLLDSYFDNSSSGTTQSAAVGTIEQGDGTAETRGEVTGLTTAQIQGEAAQTNMAGLDFETTWQTQPDDYPTLTALEDQSDDSEPEADNDAVYDPESMAGEYDSDADGQITASELGSAVTDFGQGEVTASELGEVVTAFGQS